MKPTSRYSKSIKALISLVALQILLISNAMACPVGQLTFDLPMPGKNCQNPIMEVLYSTPLGLTTIQTSGGVLFVTAAWPFHSKPPSSATLSIYCGGGSHAAAKTQLRNSAPKIVNSVCGPVYYATYVSYGYIYSKPYATTPEAFDYTGYPHTSLQN